MTISGFNEEASAKELKTFAGLILANSSNSFLNFNNPLSGLKSNGKFSYSGAPTAPNNIPSLALALEITFSVIGNLCSS